MTDVNSSTAVSPEARPGALPVSNSPASPSVDSSAKGHPPTTISLPVKHPVSAWTILGLLFLFGAVVLLVCIRHTPAGTTMALSFVSIVLEALPFVMLGSLLGGLFEVFVPRELVVGLLPRQKVYSILVAGLLGLLLPVCECAVIPFTRRLVRKGVPFSTAVAYLLAGPIVNLLVASATLMAYAWDWRILAARMAFGYVAAVAVALLVDRWFPGSWALIDPTFADSADHAGHTHGHDHGDCCGHDHSHVDEPGTSRQSIWNRLAEAVNHAGDDFLIVGQFLVLGAFVASICQTLIPRQAFIAVRHEPVLAIMIMMGMAVVLNLCSGADAFVAASFRNALPLSAQMGFMVLGPMLDLKLSAMYLSFIKKRAFIAMVALMYLIVLVLMIGYAIATHGR